MLSDAEQGEGRRRSVGLNDGIIRETWGERLAMPGAGFTCEDVGTRPGLDRGAVE
jgi:hypothetical protein